MTISVCTVHTHIYIYIYQTSIITPWISNFSWHFFRHRFSGFHANTAAVVDLAAGLLGSTLEFGGAPSDEADLLCALGRSKSLVGRVDGLYDVRTLP